jgi:hypothetical protein
VQGLLPRVFGCPEYRPAELIRPILLEEAFSYKLVKNIGWYQDWRPDENRTPGQPAAIFL